MTPRLRLPLVALLGLVAVAGCDCDPNVARTPGVFVMGPRSIDFGTSCLGDISERSIIIKNDGNSDLEILDIELTGSGFLLLEDPPTWLRPREEAVVRIGFLPEDAENYTGLVAITSDAQSNGRQTTTLVGKGFVGADRELQVLCENASGDLRNCFFVEFGEVLANTHADRDVTLRNAGCQPVNVTGGVFIPDPGRYDPADPRIAEHRAFFSFAGAGSTMAPLRLRGGQEEKVTVRFTAPPADEQPGIRLQLSSDDPNKETSEVGLFARSVLPELYVDQEVMTFYEATSGSELRKDFVIQNNGSSNLLIDAVELVFDEGNQDFRLEIEGGLKSFTLAPFESRTVTVIYNSSGPGNTQARAVVTAGDETAEVRLLGGTQPAMVVVWLEGTNERYPPIDFGVTETGVTGLRRTVIIRNEGRAPLQVNLADVPKEQDPGGSFSVHGFSKGTVQPSGTPIQFEVGFRDAVTLKDDAAKLRIQTNDPMDAMHGGVRLLDLTSTNTPNLPPVPNIRVCSLNGPDCTTGGPSGAPQVRRPLWVDGRGSTGPEAGDTLSFQWTLTRKPAGSSTARIESPNEISTRIVSDAGEYPDIQGDYMVELRVEDQFGSWETQLHKIVVAGE